jgi:hypothetical protein
LLSALPKFIFPAPFYLNCLYECISTLLWSFIIGSYTQPRRKIESCLKLVIYKHHINICVQIMLIY